MISSVISCIQLAILYARTEVCIRLDIVDDAVLGYACTKTVVDPGTDRRRGYTIFFTIIYIATAGTSRGSWGMLPPPPRIK